MQLDTQGGRAAESAAPPEQPLRGSSGWWRTTSLSSRARPDPVAAAAQRSRPSTLRSRPPSRHRGWPRRGEGDERHLDRLPQVPATMATMGLSRIIVKPVRHRSLGRRPIPVGRERDFSLLSVLLAVVLGLLLLAVGLYGIFLGMSQREYEAVPALAPVGQTTDTDLTSPSPAWKERLRALLSPGFRLADRELLTSALSTALPGFLHTGAEPGTAEESTQTQQTVGGRSFWGWLAALTGIDVRSPGSVLSYTLPGFTGVSVGDECGLARSVDLPSRGGSSMVTSVWSESTAGAGGEWPVPEALPTQFVDAPASAVSLLTPTHDSSKSSPVTGSAGTSDASADAGHSSVAQATDLARSGSGSASGRAGVSGVSPGSNDQPLVLIYHTHTAESYHEKGRESEKDHYDWNSADSGVIQVGEEITAALRAAGIPAIHSVKVNDFPAFSRSYSSSRQLVRDYLKQYPSIVVALDIHRDGTEYKPDAVRINARQTARIAFIVGSNTSVLPNPHWRENLAFAQQLHQALQEVHPGLSRGIMLREDARFNQDLLPKLLVVEVGTYTNELAEAKEAGRVLGRALADILKRE